MYILSFNFHQRNLEVLSSMLNASLIVVPSWLHLKQMFLKLKANVYNTHQSTWLFYGDIP